MAGRRAGVAGFGRILVGGVTVAMALGTVALRAQTQLEDPRNAQKIFASTCSACHKSPQGLGKAGSASFLRQHYTTGPEMSAAMAAYLASAGSGPPPGRKAEKGEKQRETKTSKREHGHPFTDGSTDVRPSARERQKTKAEHARQATREPARSEPARAEPTPIPVERPPQAAAPASTSTSTSAALSAPAAAPHAAEATTPPPVDLGIPMPEFPAGPPAELTQPPVFSTAPLP
jgi:hypothetical protein